MGIINLLVAIHRPLTPIQPAQDGSRARALGEAGAADAVLGFGILGCGGKVRVAAAGAKHGFGNRRARRRRARSRARGPH